MSIKIIALELQNVKKIQAIQMKPSENGLTIVGGRNEQGKTSVLDAIMFALGGDRCRPSNLQRKGSAVDPEIKIELSNGIRIERSGRKASLKVVDASGNRAGQALLNGLISQLALDLPKFLNASSKEKAETLLQVIGAGDQLFAFDQEEEKLYSERRDIGVLATRKKKHAEDLPFVDGVPGEEVSISELIQQQQAIIEKNRHNQERRRKRDELNDSIRRAKERISKLEQELEEAEALLSGLLSDYNLSCKSTKDLADESTAEIEANLADIDATNQKVRTNEAKGQAESEAARYQEQYDELTEQIEDVRNDRKHLLNGANLPLPGLSVESGELVYNGQKWDCMSSSEQLRVSVAIVRKLRPDCGFVLVDKTEQMDQETLAEFGKWLEAEGLQVIATRVSTGDECSIIIEDGMIAEASLKNENKEAVA
jgi:DNA repair exonuclease SbcCD ATPase subunit